jgi:hypothetical protein
MVNRVRRGKTLPQGSGETSGFMVHDTGLSTATSRGPLVVDFGDSDDAAVLALSRVAAPVLTIRKRFTIAEVNAGATIVPAVPGYKPRMVAAKAISVGGAAGAVTTVDILATASAASRKLVAFAQASLLQSAVLTDGGSGAAVLADGASYTVNDANTAVTIGKTGASVTTATHIDVVFNFVLEKA